MKVHGEKAEKCRYVICTSCYEKKVDAGDGEGVAKQRQGRSATRVDKTNSTAMPPNDVSTRNSKRNALSDDGAKAIKRGREDEQCKHKDVGSLISFADTRYWNTKYRKTLHKNHPSNCYLCKGTFIA